MTLVCCQFHVGDESHAIAARSALLQAAGCSPCIRPMPACTLLPWNVVVTGNAMQVSNDPAVALRASMNMDAQAPMTGNPDHDFAVQMSAHHWVSPDFLQQQVPAARLPMPPTGWAACDGLRCQQRLQQLQRLSIAYHSAASQEISAWQMPFSPWYVSTIIAAPHAHALRASSALDGKCALQALIYMARVAMLQGNSQPLKDLASQLIVSLTWQTGEFRQILQYEYSTIL